VAIVDEVTKIFW